MRSYDEMIQRRRAQYGDKFDPCNLVPAFVRYYESGDRIRVTRHGETFGGTVGVTTGWKPAFLLMHSTRSLGSSYVLTSDDVIVSRKPAGARSYVPVVAS